MNRERNPAPIAEDPTSAMAGTRARRTPAPLTQNSPPGPPPGTARTQRVPAPTTRLEVSATDDTASTDPIRTDGGPAAVSADLEVLGSGAPGGRDAVATPPVDEPAADRLAEAEPTRLRVLPNLHRLVWRTIVKAWDDGIVGWAAQAAFWQTLSLPPLLLGLLGSVGYVAGWFGPDTVDVVYDRIIGLAERTFSESVVTDLITPTVDGVLSQGRVGVISVGFLLSLWAGSSAMSCFIASIAHAHDQHDVRNPVWQRFFALFLYIGFLVVAVFLLPLVALGPNYLRDIVPDTWGATVSHLINYGYFPFVTILLLLVLTTLYHLALPHPLPWHRLVGGAILAGIFFWVASYLLRYYLTRVSQVSVTYGALATPIAFLLFTFFLGFAIVIGAEFNAAVQQLWPAKASPTTQMRNWVNSQTSDFTGQLKTLPDRLSTGPIRRARPPWARSPHDRDL